MTISMNKKYRTRDGREVRLLCVDRPEEWPVVGLVDGEVFPKCWDCAGRYFGQDENLNALDLIEYHEPDIRTIWVNVYGGFVGGHKTEEAAKWYAGSDCIAIAQPVTFEVKRT